MKMNTKIPKVAIFLFAAVLVAISSVSAVDDKCAACNAVAAELEIGLSMEKPRNHLDMRHRLDSKGQRQGKVIDYRVSDLRVVELLDGLCDKMLDHALEKLDSGKQAWVKVKNWDKLRTDKREARASAKDISSFCGRLLEETEDELADLIKGGFIQTGGVSKALCHDLSKLCSKARYADHPLSNVQEETPQTCAACTNPNNISSEALVD